MPVSLGNTWSLRCCRLLSSAMHRINKKRSVTVDSINAGVKACKYDVRGEIYLAAVKRVQAGKEVIYTNVGNPHALGQTPVTFSRQVLSLIMSPALLEHHLVGQMFAPDAIDRAKLYLANIKGGAGAYSDSKGNPYIRQEIANFIEKQGGGGVKSHIDNIFCGNGASEVVRLLLQTVIVDKSDGIMVPIPQYPLYSAAIALYEGQLVPYYLDEDQGWALDVAELQRAIDGARSKGVRVRALIFINPGNPTGQCLTEQNVKDILKFAHDNRIVLCADEVYQENIYNSRFPFVSARATLDRLPEPYRSCTELVSFHTVSKGFWGECGLRGGYMEMHNMDADVVDEIYKIASINLCTNLPGQIALGLMVNPPKPGDYSYAQFEEEKSAVLGSLQRRARKLVDAFNALENVDCQDTDGALYAFPRITLPPAFIAKAKKLDKSPDVLYCLELLEETGLSCVPGSGFQQAPGTFHIRTTILPQEDVFDDVIDKFTAFHTGFMKKYAGRTSKY